MTVFFDKNYHDLHGPHGGLSFQIYNRLAIDLVLYMQGEHNPKRAIESLAVDLKDSNMNSLFWVNWI